MIAVRDEEEEEEGLFPSPCIDRCFVLTRVFFLFATGALKDAAGPWHLCRRLDMERTLQAAPMFR